MLRLRTIAVVALAGQQVVAIMLAYEPVLDAAPLYYSRKYIIRVGGETVNVSAKSHQIGAPSDRMHPLLPTRPVRAKGASQVGVLQRVPFIAKRSPANGTKRGRRRLWLTFSVVFVSVISAAPNDLIWSRPHPDIALVYSEGTRPNVLSRLPEATEALLGNVVVRACAGEAGDGGGHWEEECDASLDTRIGEKVHTHLIDCLSSENGEMKE